MLFRAPATHVEVIDIKLQNEVWVGLCKILTLTYRIVWYELRIIGMNDFLLKELVAITLWNDTTNLIGLKLATTWFTSRPALRHLHINGISLNLTLKNHEPWSHGSHVEKRSKQRACLRANQILASFAGKRRTFSCKFGESKWRNPGQYQSSQ